MQINLFQTEFSRCKIKLLIKRTLIDKDEKKNQLGSLFLSNLKFIFQGGREYACYEASFVVNYLTYILQEYIFETILEYNHSRFNCQTRCKRL